MWGQYSPTCSSLEPALSNVCLRQLLPGVQSEPVLHRPVLVLVVVATAVEEGSVQGVCR
jgi:hypothetical protein